MAGKDRKMPELKQNRFTRGRITALLTEMSGWALILLGCVLGAAQLIASLSVATLVVPLALVSGGLSAILVAQVARAIFDNAQDTRAMRLAQRSAPLPPLKPRACGPSRACAARRRLNIFGPALRGGPLRKLEPMPVTLDASAADFEAAFDKLLNAKREDSPDVDAVVAEIIADVRARGDAAVIDLSQKFDRVTLTAETLRISAEEVDAAVAEVSPKTARRWNSQPTASAPITPGNCPRMRNGPTPMARLWAGAGHRFLPRASMCPAAWRVTHPRS